VSITKLPPNTAVDNIFSVMMGTVPFRSQM